MAVFKLFDTKIIDAESFYKGYLEFQFHSLNIVLGREREGEQGFKLYQTANNSNSHDLDWKIHRRGEKLRFSDRDLTSINTIFRNLT